MGKVAVARRGAARALRWKSPTLRAYVTTLRARTPPIVRVGFRAASKQSALRRGVARDRVATATQCSHPAVDRRLCERERVRRRGAAPDDSHMVKRHRAAPSARADGAQSSGSVYHQGRSSLRRCGNIRVFGSRGACRQSRGSMNPSVWQFSAHKFVVTRRAVRPG